jgi:hypothetical protein
MFNKNRWRVSRGLRFVAIDAANVVETFAEKLKFAQRLFTVNVWLCTLPKYPETLIPIQFHLFERLRGKQFLQIAACSYTVNIKSRWQPFSATWRYTEQIPVSGHCLPVYKEVDPGRWYTTGNL